MAKSLLPALALAVALFASLAWSQSVVQLVRDPEQETVMIGNLTKGGLRLACILNNTNGEEKLVKRSATEDTAATDNAVEKKDTPAHGITWTANGAPITDEKAVIVDGEKGRSTLLLAEADAEPGKYVCRSGDDVSQEWTVQPNFKLEKLPKSVLIVEGEDDYLSCKLRDAAVTDGTLEFKWFQVRVQSVVR